MGGGIGGLAGSGFGFSFRGTSRASRAEPCSRPPARRLDRFDDHALLLGGAVLVVHDLHGRLVLGILGIGLGSENLVDGRHDRLQDDRLPGVLVGLHASAARGGFRLRRSVGSRGAEVDGEDLADVRVDVEILDRLVRRGPLRGRRGLPDVGGVGVPLAPHLAGGDQGVQIGGEIGGSLGDALGLGAEALQLGRGGGVPRRRAWSRRSRSRSASRPRPAAGAGTGAARPRSAGRPAPGGPLRGRSRERSAR